jgi:transposase
MAKPLLPDDLWAKIEPLLPPPKPRRFRFPGRKPVDSRKALTGILFVLKTGIPWEDLPQEMGCGSGMTCWRRLRDWHEAGVWDRLLDILLADLQHADRIDWSRAAIDASLTRAFGGVEGSGPNPTDRSRPGVKHHVVVDGQGIPLVVDRSPANEPDINHLALMIASLPTVAGKQGRPRQRPDKLYADRGYDSDPHRSELQARGIEPVIARRGTAHGSGLGIYRWVAERALAWFHGFRKLRFVTEKTEAMQYAFLNLAHAMILWRTMQLSLC